MCASTLVVNNRKMTRIFTGQNTKVSGGIMQSMKSKEVNRGNEMDRLMDQEEVSNMLGISMKTLEYWRWKKTGPQYVKIGRLARYRLSDVMAYIQGLIGKEVIKAK
jgi:predicted DNA-binding transcriptional regulator AlpA